MLPPPVAIRDSIHADTAYQSGVLTLSHYSPNDKIWFSNGITISLYAQDPGVCGALGRSDVFGGIAVDSCDSLVDAGFRYVQTGEWQMDRAVDIYANNDTDWVNTGTFPDTLEELDSLYGNGVAGGSKAGKWLFSYDFAPQQDFTQVYHASKNIKTLFYIQSKTNKLKLRVSNILFNYSGTQIDSIKLLWAVDSLGNGKFMMPTSIKSKPTIRFASKSSSSNQYRKSILGYGFGARNQNLQNVAMYNLKGELIKGNMQRRTNQVVIYKQ